MKLRDQIELLNSEGPILIAKRFGPVGKNPAKFEVIVQKSGATWTLDKENFDRFVSGDIVLVENLSLDKTMTTKSWKYSDYSVHMKPTRSRLSSFINHEPVQAAGDLATS